MRRLFAVIVALCCVPALAFANNNCSSRDRVVERLSGKLGEVQIAVALQQNTVVEIFVNPDTRSFTIFLTAGAGLSCIVSSGENFEFVFENTPPGDDM